MASKVYDTQQAGSIDVPATCTQLEGLVRRCHHKRKTGLLSFITDAGSSCAELEHKLAACIINPPAPVLDSEKDIREFGDFGPDWSRSSTPASPERRSRSDGFTASVFQREFLDVGRPVIVTDAAHDWRARNW